MASSGTWVMRASHPAPRMVKAVRRAAMREKRAMLLPMMEPASSPLPWPNVWPSMTVVPMVRPVTTQVMVCISWLPVDTADTSAAVAKRPTIQRSTAP